MELLAGLPACPIQALPLMQNSAHHSASVTGGCSNLNKRLTAAYVSGPSSTQDTSNSSARALHSTPSLWGAPDLQLNKKACRLSWTRTAETLSQTENPTFMYIKDTEKWHKGLPWETIRWHLVEFHLRLWTRRRKYHEKQLFSPESWEQRTKAYCG